MIKNTISVFVLIVAAFSQAGQAHQATLDDAKQQEARAACGYAEGDEVLFLNAAAMRTAAQLAQALEDSSNTFPVVYDGSFIGENFRPFAGVFDRVCFYGTDLSRSYWAQARSTRFVNSSLKAAELLGARLDGASFIGTNLKDADLSETFLIGAKIMGSFSNTSLENTNFSKANMRHVIFNCGITMYDGCGWANSANYAGANLAGADLSAQPVWSGDNFAGAVFSNTRISPRAVPYLKDIILNDEPLSQSALTLSATTRGPASVEAKITAAEFFELQRETQAATIDAPSFDCAKASLPSELMICSLYQTSLRDLDRIMAQVFADARNKRLATHKEQGAWLRERNRCGESRSCLSEAYKIRLGQLFTALNAPLIMAPDERWTFHENVLPVSSAFRSTELYARISPVLANVSRQSVTLTGMENGSISAQGQTIGANAHICSMNIYDAEHDPKTGWYSATSESGQKIPLFRVWRDRLMIRYSGNSGNTPVEAQDYITCGARASFNDGYDISPKLD